MNANFSLFSFGWEIDVLLLIMHAMHVDTWTHMTLFLIFPLRQLVVPLTYGPLVILEVFTPSS